MLKSLSSHDSDLTLTFLTLTWPAPDLHPTWTWTWAWQLQNCCRRLSMLWYKLHDMRSFLCSTFLWSFRFTIKYFSIYPFFLLKVTHVHSTAGYEQVIPRLQLACDSSGFVFQKVSQILVCFLIFGTLTDSIEYVVALEKPLPADEYSRNLYDLYTGPNNNTYWKIGYQQTSNKVASLISCVIPRTVHT